MQSGIKRAASSKTAAGQTEAATGGGGSGKWQAQLISNASSHFSLTLSLCVCILFHCTVASCAVTCAAIRKCFFNLPPKEVAKGRRGRWKAREECEGGSAGNISCLVITNNSLNMQHILPKEAAGKLCTEFDKVFPSFSFTLYNISRGQLEHLRFSNTLPRKSIPFSHSSRLLVWAIAYFDF